MTLELTDENFERLVTNSSKPAVIDFWAQWCAPCITVSAAIEILADDYKDSVIVGKVDVDLNSKVTSQFGVRNMPTVLFIKNGVVVDKHVGSTSRAVLEEKLKAIL